jgi:hypothetical protein
MENGDVVNEPTAIYSTSRSRRILSSHSAAQHPSLIGAQWTRESTLVEVERRTSGVIGNLDAQNWLIAPNLWLGNATPLECIRHGDAQRVMNLLDMIEQGTPT